MARPHSLDLRRRIVAAVGKGLSRRAAAQRFAVSQSSAIKLVQRWERTGSVAPTEPAARKAYALAAHEKLVRSLVAGQPDLTLDELQERLAVEGVKVGRTSIHRYLEALGLTRKKRHSTLRSRIGPMLPRPGPSGRKARRA